MQADDLPSARRAHLGNGPRREAIDAGDALLDPLRFAEGVVSSQHHLLSHRQAAREESEVDDFLAGSPARDLEDCAGGGGCRFCRRRREPFFDSGEQFVDAHAGDRRAEQGRDDVARRDLRPQFRNEEGVAQRATGTLELRDHALIRLRQQIDHRVAPGRSGAVARDDLCRSVAESNRLVHRHDAQR